MHRLNISSFSSWSQFKNFYSPTVVGSMINVFPSSATVANLQAKVEGLTTTNALMKEDLAISKNTMITLVEENNQLKHALGKFK